MTPIFITIRVTTTGNENLQHSGSGCKKQNLYLTEGVGGGGGENITSFWSMNSVRVDI